MKLATVERNGRRWIGAVLDQGATLLDLAAAHQAATGAVSPHFVDMLALIDGGAAALALARAYLAAPPATALSPSSAARWLARFATGSRARNTPGWAGPAATSSPAQHSATTPRTSAKRSPSAVWGVSPLASENQSRW